MRIAPLAINNDYYDEDYLKVFKFREMGKDVKVHRSVVFMSPTTVAIGSNVFVGPYCVFGEGKIDIQSGTTLPPFTHIEGDKTEDPSVTKEELLKRIKELEEASKSNAKSDD